VIGPRQGALPEWRFLQLTLVICGWMLLSPQMHNRWIVQLLLQVFLLNTVLVTLWANPHSGAASAARWSGSGCCRWPARCWPSCHR